ncbi:J domain-containing protein [Mycobacterium sp. 663a-19]|uniref:J domain-containing protein n=1 Tax=Mycobacterium sp. 663a-19 TaxID=2986148 RepID=UPI002D1F5A29|nr:J domain-containing protein [Mycobacterium sp. 663a-19]MEB3983702.1 J domain-containing protein [Mycobacterium sp. 663a-19]
MTDPYNPYTVLGVSPTATQAEITHAYRRHLRDYHPDTRRKAPNPGADERLRQILAAYALLRDPSRRAEYDRAHPARAHPARDETGPVRITVTRADPGDTQSRDGRPPLWVGPVRWHR